MRTPISCVRSAALASIAPILDVRLLWIHYVDMKTAKLFRHGGSQAVRLPKEFRFDGTEVAIERRGHEVVLKPKVTPRLKTLADVARYLHEQFPQSTGFPDIEKPKAHQKRDLDF